MRYLTLAVISTAVVAFGLSSAPASAVTVVANSPPDYAARGAGHVGGESAYAYGDYGSAYIARAPAGRATASAASSACNHGAGDYVWSLARSC
jgi:hypothetical protein